MIAIARRGGRARLKASDSKSDRGASPSGVQILSPPPIFVLWRGDRAAEGAALEMPCAGRTPVPWVQIPPPPPFIGIDVAVLDGELAVPCNPQSAIAGLNAYLRFEHVRSALQK